MKIYVVVIEDRHTDIEPLCFTDKDRAIDLARATARYRNHYPKEYEEFPCSNTTNPCVTALYLFDARYSGEGDRVSVRECELQN